MFRYMFRHMAFAGLAVAALLVAAAPAFADDAPRAGEAGPKATQLMFDITKLLAERAGLSDRLRVIAHERSLLARDWRELEGRKGDVRRDTAEQQRLASELETEIRDIIAKRREAIAVLDEIDAEIEDYNDWCGDTVSQEEYDRRAPWCEENETYLNDKLAEAERREAQIVSVYEFQRDRYRGLLAEIDGEATRLGWVQELQDGLIAEDQAFQREVDGINRRYGALTRELVALTDELNRPRPPCTDEVDYAARRQCVNEVAARYGMEPADFLTKAEMILDGIEYGGGDWPLTLRYFNETMGKRLWWDGRAQAALSFVEGIYGAELLKADAEGRTLERSTLALQREALLDSLARNSPPEEDPALKGADPLAWRTRRNQLMFDALEAGNGDWWASVVWLETRFEKEQTSDLLVAKSYLEGLFGGG